MKRSGWRGFVAVLVCLGVLAIATPGHAETRALLVGVWHFQSPEIPDLQGPENDLAAMETLMRAQGATDITVLSNENVTRTTVETALHALGLRSKPGDWILFYYSGHGAEAEASGADLADGPRDQFVPLAGFNLEAQDPERFIVDKDFYAWISRYIPRTTEILMVADACHSGTLHRSIDPRAWRFTPRLAFRGDVGEIKLVARPGPRFPSVLTGIEPASPVGIQRADLPNEIYIGASLDDQLALEASLPVEGAPSRGLLTYSFEQALTAYGPDGKTLAADLDHDGTLTVGEVAVYLNTQVRALTGQRQESSAHFVTGADQLALFKRIAPPPAPVGPPPKPLPAVYAPNSAGAALLAGDDRPWRVAASASVADFVWDSSSGTVLRRSGDVVAENVRDAARLRGVIEKWDTVEQLRPFLSDVRARLTVGPGPSGARYAPGAHVDVTLRSEGAGAATRYATIFDIAADGTVQRLYPVEAADGDGALAAGASLPVLDAQAVTPFGADHVMALVTSVRPDEFRDLLRSVDGQRASGRLVAPLRAELARSDAAAALSAAELYTGR